MLIKTKQGYATEYMVQVSLAHELFTKVDEVLGTEYHHSENITSISAAVEGAVLGVVATLKIQWIEGGRVTLEVTEDVLVKLAEDAFALIDLKILQ